MSSDQLRFAVFGNEHQAEKSASVQRTLAHLAIHGAEVYIERTFYDFLMKDRRLSVDVAGVFDDYNFDVDFVISMGGDGTFLKAASRVGVKGTPVIGINMGRLGFLADIPSVEIEDALDDVLNGKFTIENHAVIQIETDAEAISGSPYALNDIAILKRDNASMISVRACINGEYLVTYQADGLVVSTPTGSTAYSLSNGGPIIVPKAGILCLTPVAPHSLTIRPIVIPDDSEITLTVESRSHNYLVAVDGRSERLREGTKVTIRKAPHSIRMIKRDSRRYFSTLREKLMWGADNRG